MLEKNTYLLVKKLAEKEKLEESKIIELFILAVQEIHQKGNREELRLIFDSEKKIFLAYYCYKIVEKVTNPIKEIDQESQSLKSKETKIEGDFLLVPINLKKLVNYEELLKVFYPVLEKAQEKKWKQEFLPLQGRIVEGIIQEINREHCLVDLCGKGTAFYPKEEWLPRERMQEGQKLWFLLKEIKKDEESQAILTRKDDLFLRKILEIEIPEIAQGLVVIKDILRSPGFISKIIVQSTVSYIKALGSCIGKNGNRIGNINKIMGGERGERIDIIDWNENINQIIIDLFYPTKIISLSKEADSLTIIVPHDQFSRIKGSTLEIKMVSDYLKKNSSSIITKVQIRDYDEMKGNDVINWNGNISFENFASYGKS